jgi:hypothetical protein
MLDGPRFPKVWTNLHNYGSYLAYHLPIARLTSIPGRGFQAAGVMYINQLLDCSSRF